MPKHPPKKICLGCFSAKGSGRLVNIEGRMNSIKYKTILQTHLLPIIEKNFLMEMAFFSKIWHRVTLLKQCAHSLKKVDLPL